MKLSDVLQLPEVVSGEKWFRPVTFKGSGMAYTIEDERTYRVPSAHGGECGMTAIVSCLAGDWESVVPGDVVDEIERAVEFARAADEAHSIPVPTDGV